MVESRTYSHEWKRSPHAPTFGVVSVTARPPHAVDSDGASQLVALIVSHDDAPIATWSGLLLDRGRAGSLLSAAAGHPVIRGVAVLATCSRTELYAEVAEPGEGATALRTLLQEALALAPADTAALRALPHAEAVHHLLRVASGLASIALGEHEVLGQVRGALHDARVAGVAGMLVQRLFERAIATGGRVRHETEIGRGALGLGAAAAAAVTDAAPPSRCALAIVVGAGHMARQAARHLRARGFSSLAIVNRTTERAEALAREVGGRGYPLTALPGLMTHARVVVSAVHSAAPVITPSTLLQARLRLDEPLQLVDLGSPPNIAAACAELPGVRRLDLDALHGRLAAARATRAAAVTGAEAIVHDEATRFLAWWRHRHLIPAARRLRERFHAEARAVVERETRHLSGQERAQLERFADALVRRLLHRPLTHLRTLAERHDVPEPSSASPPPGAANPLPRAPHPTQPDPTRRPPTADDLTRVIVDAYLADPSAAIASPPLP